MPGLTSRVLSSAPPTDRVKPSSSTVSTLTSVTTLLLASASPARATLLRAAGVDPLIQPADVDEDALVRDASEGARRRGETLQVSDAVGILARAKAEVIAGTDHGADLVLGCDSLLEMDGQALGKPGTTERARERWHRMRGRSGVLHTGHWLVSADGRAAGECVV